jgi:hypothetical protein
LPFQLAESFLVTRLKREAELPGEAFEGRIAGDESDHLL